MNPAHPVPRIRIRFFPSPPTMERSEEVAEENVLTRSVYLYLWNFVIEIDGRRVLFRVVSDRSMMGLILALAMRIPTLIAQCSMSNVS